VETGNKSYRVVVQEPIRIETCCPSPVAGKLFVSASGFSPAVVDFGEGFCDNRAVMTSEDQTFELVLGPVF
jgi:hypothetical protein